MNSRIPSTPLSQDIWLPLGDGMYNDVTVSPQPEEVGEGKDAQTLYWVRKFPKKGPGTEIANSQRAVANLKKMYPAMPVRYCTDGSWLMPYVAGTQPNDEEIAETLVDIYSRSGCIVLDGCNSTNFVKEYNGNVVCIDVDMVYHHQDKIMQDFMRIFMTGQSKLSIRYPAYLEHMATKRGMEKSVHAIRALLFLERGRSLYPIPNPLSYEFVEHFDLQWEHVPLSQESAEFREINEEKAPPPQQSSLEMRPTSPVDIAKLITAVTTHDLFLKLHQQDMGILGFFYKHFTKVKSLESQSLLEVVRHAQQDKRRGGFKVRSAVLLQQMGWFNQQNEVIQGGALDEALKAQGEVQGIRFSAKH
jgi:hypothetical protein